MKYKKGDLFDAPKGSYLVHACNCVGRWGSGVALQFAKRFPKSYEEYQKFCKNGAKRGDVFICSPEKGYQVVCMFTSKDYGDNVDSKNKIIEATKEAIRYLPSDAPLHMPMINSGLFRVPWENTAMLFMDYDQLDVTVWHQD